MRALVVVGVHPGRHGAAEVLEGVPVACPDELDLQGLDEALGEGVAGGPADPTEEVVDGPGGAQVLAVDAGVLRAL